MNRLLTNMKNKVDTINCTIEMIHKLRKGETIELNGLHKIRISAKEYSDFDFDKRLNELYSEREYLQKRINCME